MCAVTDFLVLIELKLLIVKKNQIYLWPMWINTFINKKNYLTSSLAVCVFLNTPDEKGRT